MLDKICSLLQKVIKHVVIRRKPESASTEEPYLYRFYLWRNKEGHSLYLHRFVSSDPGPEFHNHPFDFSVSLILWGGYEELRLQPDKKGYLPRRFGPLSLNVILANDFHRVVLSTDGKKEKEAWSLFYHRNRVQPWGFLYPDGSFREVSVRSSDRASANQLEDVD